MILLNIEFFFLSVERDDESDDDEMPDLIKRNNSDTDFNSDDEF